jgi:hypothetical protein
LLENVCMISLPALLMLIAANSAPVVVTKLLGDRYAAPIDGGRLLRDERPLFGPHKTWRGLVSGILAAGVTSAFMGTGFGVGAIFGALALTGDLFSSFCKRRLACKSGQSAPLLDQLPESLLPMLVLGGVLDLTGMQMLATALLFTVLDALGTRLTTPGTTQHLH